MAVYDFFNTNVKTLDEVRQSLANLKRLLNDNVYGASLLSRCRAYLSASQNFLTGASYVKAAFDTVDFDTLSEFDTSNNQFVASRDGKYVVRAQLMITLSFASDITYDPYGMAFVARIRKNGSDEVASYFHEFQDFLVGATDDHITVLTMAFGNLIELTASDYLEVFLLHDGANTQVLRATQYETFFAIEGIPD